MKYVLIIGDGMADNPVPQLENRTPLEVSNKPHIDQLARNSLLGSVLTVPGSSAAWQRYGNPVHFWM